MAVSVAGGDNQDQMILQLLLNQVDFDLEPAASVTAPRFMTNHFVNSFRQRPPQLGHLRINESVGAETLAELASRGHKLELLNTTLGAAPVVLVRDPETGLIRAAGDPKARRHAAAF